MDRPAWIVPVLAMLLAAGPGQASTDSDACESGVVFRDVNRNGQRETGEPGIAGIRVSDGVDIVETDSEGRYRLPLVDGRSRFVIKPAGYSVPTRSDGLPDFWHNVQLSPGPTLRFGGIPVSDAPCRDFALQEAPRREGDLEVLLFADPQTKSAVDVDYYARDIVEPLVRAAESGGRIADLGISLGDIVNDDLSLYPAINAVTARMRVPWLHVAGNHDLDFDAADDDASLSTYRHHFGPDTFAWEEPEASFVLLDDVIYRPGQTPAYIGGLREEQFAFLQRYLASARRDRLLVVGVHIPLFDTAPGRETFRRADRERLFAMLAPFPKVLLLSGHSHNQQHVWHGAENGWEGAQPLHEYNVGAACGAFWSGVKDAQGIPDTTMSDGTPNGHASLRIPLQGEYALDWHPARLSDRGDAFTSAMALHAPRVLRHGAWPGQGVYANVFMGDADSRVEYRVDEGAWMPMQRVVQADPRLLAENIADDQATSLRGYDRAPEAGPSSHLWRGSLPTDLPPSEHVIEVRAFDRWQGERRAGARYRLVEASLVEADLVDAED
jgi:hypothetical protein